LPPRRACAARQHCSTAWPAAGLACLPPPPAPRHCPADMLKGCVTGRDQTGEWCTGRSNVIAAVPHDEHVPRGHEHGCHSLRQASWPCCALGLPLPFAGPAAWLPCPSVPPLDAAAGCACMPSKTLHDKHTNCLIRCKDQAISAGMARFLTFIECSDMFSHFLEPVVGQAGLFV
jgi:hypothetical protein